ncbi:MAG: hypothetical protein J6Z03_10020, partial [Erysipelotrichaceae bacterium]|nr:hypothetical protein [Erysipelotrichaceae bacterium]
IRSDTLLSIEAYDELNELADILMQSLRAVDDMLNASDHGSIGLLRENEDRIDELCMRNREAEIRRMKENIDEPNSGIVYSELLVDIERIGDHLISLAETLVNE